MKKFFAFLFLLVCVVGVQLGNAADYTYGPALQGSYKAVTVSVTAATGPTIKAVSGSTSNRSLAVLRNCHASFDLYWGEGASISTVNTWHVLTAGQETEIFTCNFAPGTWGATNKGIYIKVTPTPMTADVADFRSYILMR